MSSLLRRFRQSSTGSRLRMAASLPGSTMSRDPSARAVSRALLTTALDRLSSEEREWVRRIESRRERLLSDPEITEPVYDPGTPGPKGDLQALYEPVRVELASEAMSLPAVWCRLLMRLVRELRPQRCLELGTAFGISAAYQAAALELNGSGTLTTLEGAREWATIAEQGFDELGLTQVQTLVGPIEQTLPEAADPGRFGYALVDAEHTGEAILRYFDTMLPLLADGAVVVFDDIDWSEEAWSAWRSIAGHDRVASGVALGRMGVAVISGA